jgi:hypothetical protein
MESREQYLFVRLRSAILCATSAWLAVLGAVGQPRDGTIPHSTSVKMKISAGTYDFETTASKFAAGLPKRDGLGGR